MHGCDSDVEWLQRDFSVYLVNVFDTHQAGKLLSLPRYCGVSTGLSGSQSSQSSLSSQCQILYCPLPRLSLAWLLQNYCGLQGDKQFQLADWRIRYFNFTVLHQLLMSQCEKKCLKLATKKK